VANLNGIGEARRGEGVYRAARGGDPTSLYEEAIAAYREARELAPDAFLLDYNLAEALRSLASQRIAQGGDGRRELDEARRILDGLRARKPPNLPDVEEAAAALELATARAGTPSAAATALSLLRGLAVTPRRMALRALAVAYLGGKGVGDEAAALRRWAEGTNGSEAIIVRAALDTVERKSGRAALEEHGRQRPHLLADIRPLLAEASQR
jgi:tetratricopeptide (TPR) repeat protein